MHVCSAFFFDGKTSTKQAVKLEIAEHGLEITPEQLGKNRLYWPKADYILIQSPTGSRPAIISSQQMPLARLIIDDSACYEAISDNISHAKTVPIIALSLKSILKWFVLMVLIMALIIWLVPLAAKPIAKLTPNRFKTYISHVALNHLVPEKNYCVAPLGVEALEKLTATLSDAAEITDPIQVMVVDDPEIQNAFAIPGGIIVVYSGLLDLIEQQSELVGILAHEMGHIREDHPSVQLIRALGFNFLLKAMMGDWSSHIAGEFLITQHSRKAEFEADNIAIQIMQNLKLNPIYFVQILERLSLDETPDQFDFLSTHPTTQARIERIKQNKQSAAEHSILTHGQWRSLKHICSQ